MCLSERIAVGGLRQGGGLRELYRRSRLSASGLFLRLADMLMRKSFDASIACTKWPDGQTISKLGREKTEEKS